MWRCGVERDIADPVRIGREGVSAQPVTNLLPKVRLKREVRRTRDRDVPPVLLQRRLRSKHAHDDFGTSQGDEHGKAHERPVRKEPLGFLSHCASGLLTKTLLEVSTNELKRWRGRAGPATERLC